MESRTEDELQGEAVSRSINEDPSPETVIKKNNFTLEPSLFLVVFAWSLTSKFCNFFFIVLKCYLYRCCLHESTDVPSLHCSI